MYIGQKNTLNDMFRFSVCLSGFIYFFNFKLSVEFQIHFFLCYYYYITSDYAESLPGYLPENK